MGKHQKAVVRKALSGAEEAGKIVLEVSNRHRWGEVVCPTCQMKESVARTPKNDSVAARRVDEFVRRHKH